MKLLILAIACFALVAAEDPKIEDGVYVLDEKNYLEFIENNPFVLVEFYAKWCGHCKNFGPEYSKAAKQLARQKSEIKLAKVDGPANKRFTDALRVRGFPTLKFYKGSFKDAYDYNGGRTADTIVEWVEKKSGPSAKALDDVAAADEFQNVNSDAIIGFFKNQESEGAKAFLRVSAALEQREFGITSDSAVFKKYGVTGDEGIILFQDSEKAVFDGQYTYKAISDFIHIYSLPLLVEFSEQNSKNIFSGPVKRHVVTFISDSASEYKEVKKMLTKVAKDYRGKLIFLTLDHSLEDHKPILEFFNLKEDEYPTMRIADVTKRDVIKYKPEDPSLSEKNVRSFVQDFLDGKLKKALKSDDVPEDWDKEPVKVLVGKNFNEVAYDKSKDVLVKFYTPWCGHCKKLAPIYDEVGNKFANFKDLVIAKMDVSTNEAENLEVQNFPTIRLYKKNTKEVVEFGGERTLEGLTSFIESDGAEGAKSEEQEVGDEGDEDPERHEEL